MRGLQGKTRFPIRLSTSYVTAPGNAPLSTGKGALPRGYLTVWQYLGQLQMIATLRSGWSGLAGMQTASIPRVGQLRLLHRNSGSSRPARLIRNVRSH